MMVETKKTFVSRMYLYMFLTDFAPIYPIYALMFQDRSGLSLSAVSVLFLIYTLTALLAEIPTGIIADKFSRKWSLVLGDLCKASSFLVWIFFPSFIGYALGFIVWGIGYALVSGAFQAYVYDELVAIHAKNSFSKVYARATSFNFAGLFFAFAVASVVGVDSYGWLLGVSTLTSLLAALVIAFADEAPRKKSVFSIRLLKKAFRFIIHRKEVLILVIVAGLSYGFLDAIDEVTPVYLRSVGLADNLIAPFLTISLLSAIVFTWFVDRLSWLNLRVRIVILLASSSLFLLTSFMNLGLALVGWFVFFRIFKLMEVLLSASIQDKATSEIRATMGSIPTFLGEIITLLFFVILSLVSRHLSELNSVRFLFIIFICVSAILLVFRMFMVRGRANLHR